MTNSDKKNESLEEGSEENCNIYQIKGAWKDNVFFRKKLLYIKGSKTPFTGRIEFNFGILSHSIYKKGILLKSEYYHLDSGFLYMYQEYGEAGDYIDFQNFFKNGQLKSREFCFRKSDKTTHGFYEEYYDNGVLAAKGDFLESLVTEKHGLWKLFNRKGQLVFSVYLDNGDLQDVIPGNFIKLEDGLIYELKNNHPKEKPYTGIMYIHMQHVASFESSPKFEKDQVDLKLRIPYKNGLKHGVYAEFQDTGGEGAFHDHHSRSYYNKSVMMDIAVKYAMDIKELMPAYISKEDHEGYALSIRRHYKNGLREGLSEEFHPNGICKSSIMYTKDKPNGLWLEKYQNGQTTYLGYFRDGQPSGLISQWDRREGFRSDWKNLRGSKWTSEHTVNTNYDDNCNYYEEYSLYKKNRLNNDRSSFK